MLVAACVLRLAGLLVVLGVDIVAPAAVPNDIVAPAAVPNDIVAPAAVPNEVVLVP